VPFSPRVEDLHRRGETGGTYHRCFAVTIAVTAITWQVAVLTSQAEERAHPAIQERTKSSAKAQTTVSALELPEETQATEYDPVELSAKDLELDAEARRQAEATARFMHGLILEDEGEFDKAIGEFQKVIDIDPSNWMLASRLAAELVKRGEIARAIDILKNTADARPRDARPLLLLANIYNRHLGKPEVALRYAERALKLSPDTFDPYATLHEVHTALGNTSKAKEILKSAEAHNSTDGEFWLRLGTMRAAMEIDTNNATPPGKEVLHPINAIFEKAAAYGAENINILSAVADYYVLTRQLARAIPYYEKAVDLEPSRMDLLEKLGRSYQEAERHADAIGIFKRMVEINPLQPGIYYVLGLLYSKIDNPEKAAEAFERSAEINPTEPDAFLEAARLLIQINQHDRAIKLLDKAIKQFPEFEIEISFQLLYPLRRAQKHDEALSVAERILAKVEAERPELLSVESVSYTHLRAHET
jgi:tetratricopeptide (TPR) repeat protein